MPACVEEAEREHQSEEGRRKHRRQQRVREPADELLDTRIGNPDADRGHADDHPGGDQTAGRKFLRRMVDFQRRLAGIRRVVENGNCRAFRIVGKQPLDLILGRIPGIENVVRAPGLSLRLELVGDLRDALVARLFGLEALSQLEARLGPKDPPTGLRPVRNLGIFPLGNDKRDHAEQDDAARYFRDDPRRRWIKERR